MGQHEPLITALQDILPSERLRLNPRKLSHDICGFELGQALVHVMPQSTEEVAAVVKAARQHGGKVVPIGLRTSYWKPLNIEGAIALSLEGLNRLGDDVGDFEPVWCGAGTTVREIFDAFAARGQTLVCHPDAYGDTGIGAMVATGFTSGIGTGVAGLDGLVAGLKVVLGTGEIVTTGTGAVLGAAPFIRHGLPDLTGAFCASGGALGVVCEVAVRPWPKRHIQTLRATVPGDVEALGRVAQLAEALREPGVYETFRAVSNCMPPKPRESFVVDIMVRSPEPGPGLVDRIARVEDAMRGVLGVDASQIERPSVEECPRWWGPAGAHWDELGGVRLSSLDVNLPYSQAQACLAEFETLLEEAQEHPFMSLRWALYAAPDHLNVGVHLVSELEGGLAAEDARQFMARHMAKFAQHEVVPYRWGRLWREPMRSRLDPTYLALMKSFKAACDPDGILHPGASLWSDED